MLAKQFWDIAVDKSLSFYRLFRSWEETGSAEVSGGANQNFQEDRTMFELSIPLFECKLYTQYTCSVCSAEQSLSEIVQCEACRKEWRSVFSTCQSVLLGFQFICNNRALEGRVTETLADLDSDRERRHVNNCFKVSDMMSQRGNTAQNLKKGWRGKKWKLR